MRFARHVIHTLVIGTQNDKHCIQVTDMWRGAVRVVSKANKDRTVISVCNSAVRQQNVQMYCPELLLHAAVELPGDSWKQWLSTR